MCQRYRVRVRRGDIELEVESSERSFVDQKLAELLVGLTDETPLPKPDPKPGAPSVASGNKARHAVGRAKRTDQELHDLVQFIRQHDDIDAVDSRILSKSSQLPRILMCLFYGEHHFDDPYLTTGEVEFVTDQLGVRIKRGNAGTVLKKHPRFVTTDAVRKKGAIVGYKLTRNGKKHFEGLIEGKEM